MDFKLVSDFSPSGDQPQAIDKLVTGLGKKMPNQVLLGVTGSGKTFTMAKVIETVQRPTLIISHNKTLAAQLYQEFREFFPQNAVSYFVSYYDFYQPEAYIPQTDTYIEKETEINEEIDKLRLQTTTNLMTRKDVIVVASVSCIYNLGSPEEYGRFVLELSRGNQVENYRRKILTRLTELQYARSDFDFKRGTFRVRGDTVDIFPSYDDFGLRLEFLGEKLTRIAKMDTLDGHLIDNLEDYAVYPAKHYMTDPLSYEKVFVQIRKDLEKRVKELNEAGKILEAHRLNQRVNYDLEMISEVGYVNGIENYSRYFDGRKPGDAPFSLMDYFPKDYLLMIDESHMTIPQIRGMYNGDRSRKQTLIDYGFRLPAALDNRPLRFDEFQRRQGQTIYVSATPDEWEVSVSEENIAEQLIRPTGLVDPRVTISPTQGQIKDLIGRIKEKAARGERALVTTLTKRTAEELTDYLKEKENLKVAYLHSDIQTLERSDILRKLRLGEYDVVVGINLLREGLDLPEVSLVAILDADKEGFLRSKTSLIQTMGRAARHVHGEVIMYADKVTAAMEESVQEINRRRKFQLAWNEKHQITPQSIVKPIREAIIETAPEDKAKKQTYAVLLDRELADIDIEQLTPEDKEKLKKVLERRMKEAARILDFEGAAFYRDKIKLLE